MHLIDDPRAWILRFFEREEREGRGMYCHTFPEGCIPPDAPLVDGEMVYGIYKEKYLFTPQSLILRMPKGNLRIAWRDIQSCSTQHGDGNKKSRLSLKDGSTIDIQMDELAKGWSGRISQLFHQMIERHGGANFGLPLYTIEEFFATADDDYCLAPNLEPHPTLDAMRKALIDLRDRPRVTDVLITVDELEAGVPIADTIVVRTTFGMESLKPFAEEFRTEGVSEASENVRRKVGELGPDEKLWQIVWD